MPDRIDRILRVIFSDQSIELQFNSVTTNHLFLHIFSFLKHVFSFFFRSIFDLWNYLNEKVDFSKNRFLSTEQIPFISLKNRGKKRQEKMPSHRSGRLKQSNKKHKTPGGTRPSNEHALAGRVQRKSSKTNNTAQQGYGDYK